MIDNDGRHWHDRRIPAKAVPTLLEDTPNEHLAARC